jgi:putative membrane protein
LQVPYPLLCGAARDRLTRISVAASFSASVAHAVRRYGARRAATIVATTAGGGLTVEAVGVRTSFPFGRYEYAGRLGPSVGGVPLLVAMAWTMMGYPAWVSGRRLGATRPAQAAIGAAALTGWDLFLDPQMVAAGHWRWRSRSRQLPGVPELRVANMAGWAATAIVLAGALAARAGEPRDIPEGDGPAYALFLWAYASSLLANVVFFRRPAVAAWGGAGMGATALPLARSLLADRRRR